MNRNMSDMQNEKQRLVKKEMFRHFEQQFSKYKLQVIGKRYKDQLNEH